MQISVVGCGAVGSVVAACFAQTGNHVVGADIDAGRVRSLQEGEPPFYEPGLRDIVQRNLRAGRLRFTCDLAEAGKSAVVFFSVGTPPAADGSADLSHLLAAAEGVGRGIAKPSVLAIKSSVPVGTTERVARAVRKTAAAPVDFAYVPEFLKEGDAVRDFFKPDRVVVGADKPEVFELMRRLHEPFLRTMNPLIEMDIRSAEMTKYASNYFLAARISSINEIAALCERTGADVEMVRRGAGADSRIGYQFLFPGVGYGGSCFPKDVDALVRCGTEVDLPMDLARSVQRVNAAQRERFAKRIVDRLADAPGGLVAVWGLAFKPRTDDLRESPAVELIERLLAAGLRVAAHDPRAGERARERFADRIRVAADPYDALDGADALALVTEWDEFRMPEFEEIRRRLRRPILFDGRNIWDPKQVRSLGFEYFAVGRP